MTPNASAVLLYAYATNGNVWDGYVASAGSTYTGDGSPYGPYLAFVENPPSQSYNDAWSSSNSSNDWIQLKLDTPKVCTKMGFCPRYGWLFNSFRTAQLLGSNDGTNFTQLAALSLDEQPTTNDEILWDIPNTQAYLYYRLHLDNCFGDRISVGRFRLYGHQ